MLSRRMEGCMNMAGGQEAGWLDKVEWHNGRRRQEQDSKLYN